MSEENIYGRYHIDLPEPPAEPVQPAEEQLGGRFAAAAAKAAPVETPANEQLGGRFAAAFTTPEPAETAPIVPEIVETASVMEEGAAETLLPAEAEVLPAVQGEVLPAVPKKKMSKKTLFTLLGIVAAVVLAVVLVASGVFRPSDEKLMEKYTALAAEGDYEGIDELLHKASKWERYQFVSDVLELEYEAGNVYDYFDLLELLPAERQLLEFDQWYEAYQTALYDEFVSQWGVATSFGRVCDDFYRSGLLTREELIERCAAGEDRGDENLCGEYAALLGGSGAGKLLPVYCKSWGSTAFVDYGLLAALPQEIRASSYEEADYVLECFYDRYADGRYRLGGTGYRVSLSFRIVDLDGNVLYESDSVRGSASPSVIHYIGDAYGSEPSVSEHADMVGGILLEYAYEQDITIAGVSEDVMYTQLAGTWTGYCSVMEGDEEEAGEYDTVTVIIENDGKGTCDFDTSGEHYSFTLQPESVGFGGVAASFTLNETKEKGHVEMALYAEDGARSLEGIAGVYGDSDEEFDRAAYMFLEELKETEGE